MIALEKTYIINQRNIKDIENLLVHLGQVRRLLSVQMEVVEEEIMRANLW